MSIKKSEVPTLCDYLGLHFKKRYRKRYRKCCQRGCRYYISIFNTYDKKKLRFFIFLLTIITGIQLDLNF